MPRTINPTATRTPSPVRSIAPAPPADVVLTFTLDEARTFRTALGTIGLLEDLFHVDIRNVIDDENYVIDAPRIAALHDLVNALIVSLDVTSLTRKVCDGIEVVQAEERAGDGAKARMFTGEKPSR